MTTSGVEHAMPDQNLPDVAEIERRLRARRGELMALTEDSAEARSTVELDQTRVGRLSRMDALQGQAMSQETERRRQVELARIDAALQRLAEGSFGFCVNCDEEIEPKRLELDPSLPTCLSCAQQGGD